MNVIDRAAVQAALADGQPLRILEALPPKYFHQGHLPGAKQLDYQNAVAHAERLHVAKADRVVVYCASDTLAMAAEHLSRVATVVDGGRPVRMRRVSEDLHARGVRRLMVEGGGEVHTQFLSEGLADELRLVVAPLFVGQREATRFVGPGRFPFSGSRRARLVESRPIGDVVLLRYALSPRFSEGAW